MFGEIINVFFFQMYKFCVYVFACVFFIFFVCVCWVCFCVCVFVFALKKRVLAMETLTLPID